MFEFPSLSSGLLQAAFRSRADVVAGNLVLRHQLAALIRPTPKRSRLRSRDKLFWILVRKFRPDWRRHLVIARPEAVIRRHWQARKLCWRWHSRVKLRRPRLSPEVRELTARTTRENPTWGSERLRGEPLQ